MAAVAGSLREKLFGEYEMPNRDGRDYVETLEAAWQDYLAPREPGAPTVVSLFAGCGGSSLGYSMAGYRELLAVEWDANAVETFKLNFPGVPVWHGDIHKLSVDGCLEAAGLEPGELDVLDGSPPCQGFSTAGKRKMGDERNRLYLEYVRLLRGLRPKVLVMENVSGLVKGKMKLVFAEITRELKASGYRVSCRLMNAMYFGVPQSRQRLIWIGVREDLAVEPSHPGAEGRPPTVEEAWKDCPTEPAPRLSPKLTSVIGTIPVWGDGGDSVGAFFSTKRLAWDRPSRTLPKGNVGTRACHVHPDGDRAITEAEAKRIGSFPDGFRFVGGYRKSLARIGNSVPPLFMRSIAMHVRDLLSEADGHADQAGAGGGPPPDVGAPDPQGEPAHA
jgi:DNA (cytosine-5)-methyltransferase 1